MASPAAYLSILVDANTGLASSKLASLNSQLKATEVQASKTSTLMGGKFGKAAKTGLAAVGIAAAAAAAELYKTGEEFDKAYDKIRVGTGKTGKQLKALEADFRSVYQTTPAGMNEVADAISGVTRRLGLTGGALRRESKQFVELSRITGTDLNANLKAVARSFEDWDVPVKKQTKQLDEFYRASELSGISVDDLTTLLAKFGSPLRLAGFSLEEATAMFASFEKTGVNIQTMLPGLRMAIKNLLKEGVAPEDLSKKIKELFHGIETGAVPATRSLEIFGTKAGADMIEAVDQGRFHLAKFQKQVETGNDTINKAGKETNDFAENMRILWHRIQVAVEPVASAIYKAIGKASGALARFNFRKFFHEIGPTVQPIIQAVQDLGRTWAKVFGPIMKDALRGVIQAFRGFAQVLKGIAEVITGVLHGDFSKVWAGIKDIFSGGTKFILGNLRATTAPFRAVAGHIKDALVGGFTSAWSAIKGVFIDGVNAVIRAINYMIEKINDVPVLPDIGSPINEFGSGPTFTSKKEARALGKRHAGHRARGGFIDMGAPSGDTVPAVLERGEYVLNRKAVQAAGGAKALDQLNFRMAPRFAKGGMLEPNVNGFLQPIVGHEYAAAQQYLAKHRRRGGKGGVPPGGLRRWLTIALKLTGHYSGSNLAGLYKQAMSESGGDPHAINLWDSNAAAGHPSKGLLQTIDSTFNAYKMKGHGNIWNPVDNAIAAIRYMYARYGHIVSTGEGYAAGGPVKGTAARAVAWARNNLGTQQGSAKQRKWAKITHGPLDPWCAEFVGADMLAQGLGLPANPALSSSYATSWPDGSVVGRSLSVAKAGDLLNFSGAHIGMYIGGGQMISGNFSDEVMKTPVSAGPAPLSSVIRPHYPGGTGKGGRSRTGAKGRAAAHKIAREIGLGKGKAIEGIGHGHAVTLGPLGASPLPGSASGLAPRFQKMLNMPGLGYAGQVGVSERALESAGRTETTADDLAVLAFQEDLFKGRRARLSKQLKRINHALAKRGLTKKQRAKLLGKREHILEERGGVEGQLIGVESQREELAQQEQQREEERKQVEEEHTAALKEVAKAMHEQTTFAERAIATNSAQAWRALADIMSGQLGPTTAHRAKTAGDGTPGTVVRT